MTKTHYKMQKLLEDPLQLRLISTLPTF